MLGARRNRAARRAVFAALSLSIALLIATMAPAGCAGDAAVAPPATTPDAVSSTVPDPPAGAGLALEQVANAGITLKGAEGPLTFTLVDGSYQSGEGGDGSGLDVSMLDAVAFGDLNRDGVGDAAIVLSIQWGDVVDSGNTDASEYVVALLAQDGGAIQGGYYMMGSGMMGSGMMGSGTRIDAVSIRDGEIGIEAMVPGQQGPTEAPGAPLAATLRVPANAADNRELLLTSQTWETPEGDVREIIITSPEPETGVLLNVEITGTVTVAPSEDGLVYEVYDDDLAQLTQGPLTVDAVDPGALGTFTFPLDVYSLQYVGRIIVTVSDLSAVDGSVIARDSLDLTAYTSC